MGGTVTASILFTDLVGSTSLSSRLGEDRSETLRREHFALLRKAIDANDGVEVKNLGDGIMVAFDGVVPALSCAAAMQQHLDDRNARTHDGEHLGLRIGLSVGECDVDGADYFGPPVVEAARLCAVAEGGQILTTELVRALVGTRGGFELLALGSRELKGFPEPTPVHELVWTRRTGRDALPLPPRLGDASPFGFVGRTAEREHLAAAWKDTLAGERRSVLLGGEPGVGKTSLTSEFARQAHADGGLVVYGRCDEDLGIPYQPWVEIFGFLAANAEATLRDTLGPRAGDLAVLAPALRDPDATTAGRDPESERFVLFAAVAVALQELGNRQPVVVVLEDLHWADRPTLQLLRHLLSTSGHGRLLVLGTFRDAEVDEQHPMADLLAALHREEGSSRLALRGLDDDELVDLLRTVGGQELGGEGIELAHALGRETNGNPFFAVEILRHLAETGAIIRDDDGQWVGEEGLLDRGLPVSVREVVSRRVARLGEAASGVLRAASVIGREFDLDLLAEVVDLDPELVIDRLEDAVNADLLHDVGPGRYAFVHALVEHTLYDAITSTRRARLHRRVAEAIEDLDFAERLGELAYHWAEATSPTDFRKAIDYAQRAGDHALAALAPDEAGRWYQQALDLLDDAAADPTRRCDLLIGLGEAQRHAGRAAYRETLFAAADAAEALGDVPRLVRAALANGRPNFSRFGFIDAQRVALLRRAIAALGSDDTAHRARLLARLAVELTYTGEIGERKALSDEALATARTLDDPPTLLAVLLPRFDTIGAPETITERQLLATETLALAAQVGDPVALFYACHVAIDTDWPVGNVDSVDDRLDRLREIAARLDQPTLHWMTRYKDAERALVAGDAARGEELADEALALGLAIDAPDALTYYAGQCCIVRFMQGRLVELIELFEAVVAENPGIAVQDGILAWAYAIAGRTDDATRLLAPFRDGIAELEHDEQWTFTTAVWARTIRIIGDTVAAEGLYRSLTPWGHLYATTGVFVAGPVSLYLGMLAVVLGRPEARDHLTHAVAAAEHIGDPFHAAEARILLAESLGATDRAGRETLLDDAATGIAGRGYAGLEEQLAAVRQR